MDIRDQFRKVGDDVGKMARDVADGSKKVTARARLRRMIQTSSTAQNTVYKEIGAKYYEESKAAPEEQYEELFRQVEDLQAQIDELKSEMAALDNASICVNCGFKLGDLQKFCPECGTQNASYGKWKAEAEAAEAQRRAAKEAEQAERAARKAEKEAQEAFFETTAEAVQEDEEDEEFSSPDATVSVDDDEA